MSDEITNTTTGAPAAPAESSASAPDFISSLPEDIRGEASLANIKDVGALATGYVHAQKMIGSSLRVPGPEASPEAKSEFFKKLSTVDGVVKLPNPESKEEVDAFFAKLGRPATPDEYKIQLDPAIQADPAVMNEFKTLAHSLGLNNQQAAALVGFEQQRTLANIAQIKATQEATVSLLKNVWGNDFDNRLTAGKEVLKHFGAKYPNEVAALIGNGKEAGNNAVFMMMAAELGKMYTETGAIQGKTELKYGLTPQEATLRLEELKKNTGHAYFNVRDPKHTQALEEVAKLYAAAYPEPK